MDTNAAIDLLVKENDKLRERYTWQENEIERLTQICIILGRDPWKVNPADLAAELAAQGKE